MKLEAVTHSAEQTVAFGRQLVPHLVPPKFVLLRGELGAGKTTLVKGIAEAFDAADSGDVTSPTFTLVHEYRGPNVTVYHIDLYRIETVRELETLAIDDLIESDSLLLVEWGDKFAQLRKRCDAEIAIERVSENERRIVFTAPLVKED